MLQRGGRAWGRLVDRLAIFEGTCRFGIFFALALALAHANLERSAVPFAQDASNLRIGEAAGRLQFNGGCFAGFWFPRGNRQQSVFVELKVHHHVAVDGQFTKPEATQGGVLFHRLRLPLVDLDHDVILFGGDRSKWLFRLARDACVAPDDDTEPAALGTYTERVGRDILQHDIQIAVQGSRLQCRSLRNDFVGVDAFSQLATKQFGNDLLDRGHACHSANEQNVVDVVGAKPAILQGHRAWIEKGAEFCGHQFLKGSPVQFVAQVQRRAAALGNEGNFDAGVAHVRELVLCLPRGMVEALHCRRVVA